MNVTEIDVKTALNRSGIPGVSFAINPYTGCAHGCHYCYATFMSRYSRHYQDEAWGSFVEVKTNIVDVLDTELRRKRKTGTALLSSVCDPYQPAEQRYTLTRRCILALREHGWGVDILTRSPMVTRDIDLLATCIGASVGFSIPTDDDSVRKITEPHAPSIDARIQALKKVHAAGIRTWVFIAPMLPMRPDVLAGRISPYIDHVMIDPLNYKSRVASLFRQHGWNEALTPKYAQQTRAELMQCLRPAKQRN